MSDLISVDKAVLNKKSFTLTTDLTNIDTDTEKPLLLLRNPSSGGLRSLITHFKFGTDSANVRSLIRIYKNPTVTTEGTALTIVNTYIEQTVRNSVMTAFKLPTISANGTVLNIDINPSNTSSRGLNRLYWFEGGNDVLVTVENSSPNAKTFADIYWLEGV